MPPTKKEAWQEPNLGLKGTAQLVDKQRLVLLGQRVPNLNPDALMGERKVGANTRCQWPRQNSKVSLVHKEESIGTPAWRTHTAEVHDEKTRSASARWRMSERAKEGARAASANQRLQQDFKHSTSQLSTIVDVDRSATPQPSNLMPKHQVERRKTRPKVYRNQSQISFGTHSVWLGKSSTAAADFSHDSISNFVPREPLTRAKGHMIEIERHCDGPTDDIVSHNQRVYQGKQVARVRGGPPRGQTNASQPAMKCVMGEEEMEANYTAEVDKPYKAAVGAKLTGGNKYSADVEDIMKGLWMDDGASVPYETEYGKELQEKRCAAPRPLEQNITKSNVNFGNRFEPVAQPYATTTAHSMAEAAEHLVYHPRPKARFPCNRTLATVGTNLSRHEAFGPVVVGLPPGTSDAQDTTGLHYRENKVNRQQGVNAAEYGQPGVWSVRQPEAQYKKDRYTRVTSSAVQLTHGVDNDPKFIYKGNERGGWYATAHKDHYASPGHKYPRTAAAKGQLTVSGVPNLQPSMKAQPVNEDDVYNRSVPMSHEQFIEHPNTAYVQDYKNIKHMTAERARNASDMMLWRHDSTGFRFQHRVQEAERGQTKAGRNIYPS
mmetsp:Transcript_28550/g.54497  ORF Transcript_28550/g.54497 Transcript_28550/m.54497 type:complete len:604 (+) Transcript_28550:171-1982(+)